MVDFMNCPCSGVTLDKLIQPAILAALAEEPAHGYRIAERIARDAQVRSERSPTCRESIGSSRTWNRRDWWSRLGKHQARDTPNDFMRSQQPVKRCLAQWAETLETY